MTKVLKGLVGSALAERVKDSMVIGVGTGSTVDAAIASIGERVRSEGLRVYAVTSSRESAALCECEGLIVLDRNFGGDIAFGFDGVDAIDAQLRAIKGRGGAMLREKILAVRCKSYVLIGDESKFVADIAKKSYVPVEVIPEALSYVAGEMRAIGARQVDLRQATAKHGAVITESGNCILDTWFDTIQPDLETRIKSVIGVVESGLFLSYATEALIARESGIERLITGGTK